MLVGSLGERFGFVGAVLSFRTQGVQVCHLWSGGLFEKWDIKLSYKLQNNFT